MTRLRLFSLFLAIGFLPLNGCMAGMHGMGDDSNAPADRAKRVNKEFHEKGLVVSVKIPDLLKGWESTFTIKIREIASEAPVTGAKVAVFFRRVGRPVGEEGGLMERQAREIHERGLYQLRQTFEEAGSYEITFNVWPGGDQTGSPLTLSAVEEVAPPVAVRDRPSMTSFYVAGGAMVVMMVLLMAL
ncbi:MAG: hypothetical protein EPO39_10590 [Candidatus Manganitrophaceae bacterium]|nr:MAG: hypothetical protein EPO39_10590 [Candidatus Manganitrophaceae bacterium]